MRALLSLVVGTIMLNLSAQAGLATKSSDSDPLHDPDLDVEDDDLVTSSNRLEDEDLPRALH